MIRDLLSMHTVDDSHITHKTNTGSNYNSIPLLVVSRKFLCHSCSTISYTSFLNTSFCNFKKRGGIKQHVVYEIFSVNFEIKIGPIWYSANFK